MSDSIKAFWREYDLPNESNEVEIFEDFEREIKQIGCKCDVFGVCIPDKILWSQNNEQNLYINLFNPVHVLAMATVLL